MKFPILLSICLLFGPCAALGGELLFQNGDRLPWTSPRVEGDFLLGNPPWEGAEARAPLHSVRRWQSSAEPPAVLPGQAWLGLRDGSMLLASEITVQADTLRWTSTWGASLSLPLELLRTLTPVQAADENAVQDLLDPKDWQVRGRAEQPPQRVGMELHVSGADTFNMFRELPLADPVRVDITLRFDQSPPNYILGLHVPRPVNLGRGGLRVLTHQGRTRLSHDHLVGMHQPEDVVLSFEPDRHRLHHIRIHSDWEAGHFELWINGLLHRKWFRPGDTPKAPPWVGLGFFQGHPAVIESFRISPWARVSSMKEAAAIPSGHWQVLLRNGDEVSGEILSLDATHLRLRMSEDREVPLRFGVIRELRAPSAGEAPVVPMELRLHGGQRLRAGVEDWDADALAVRLPGGGAEWRIPRAYLSTLLFNPAQSPAEPATTHTLRFHSGHRLRGELTGLSERVLRMRPWFDDTIWELPLARVRDLERAGGQTHTSGDRVRFVNGDFLRGTLLESPEGATLLDHPFLGRLRLRPETLLTAERQADGFWIDRAVPPGQWQVAPGPGPDTRPARETPQGLLPGSGQLNHALPLLPDRVHLHLRLRSPARPFFQILLWDGPPGSADRDAPLRISVSNGRPRLLGDSPGPVLSEPVPENNEYAYMLEFDFITHEVFLLSEDRKHRLGTFPKLGTREGFWFAFGAERADLLITDLRLGPPPLPPPAESRDLPGAARVHLAEGGQRALLSGWREEEGALRLRSPLWEGEAILDPRQLFRWEAVLEPRF